MATKYNPFASESFDPVTAAQAVSRSINALSKCERAHTSGMSVYELAYTLARALYLSEENKGKAKSVSGVAGKLFAGESFTWKGTEVRLNVANLPQSPVSNFKTRVLQEGQGSYKIRKVFGDGAVDQSVIRAKQSLSSIEIAKISKIAGEHEAFQPDGGFPNLSETGVSVDAAKAIRAIVSRGRPAVNKDGTINAPRSFDLAEIVKKLEKADGSDLTKVQEALERILKDRSMKAA